MELTGKCKDAFNDYLQQIDKEIFSLSFVGGNYIGSGITVSNVFMEIPFSMQYGVYVDFFDENGLYINIRSESVTEAPYWTFTIDFNGLGHEGDNSEYLEHQEARIEAIKKANEIFNNG